MLSVFVAFVFVLVIRRSRTRRPGFRCSPQSSFVVLVVSSCSNRFNRRHPSTSSSSALGFVRLARTLALRRFVALVSCLGCVVRSVRCGLASRSGMGSRFILIPRSSFRHLRVSRVRPSLAPPLSLYRRCSPFRRFLFSVDASRLCPGRSMITFRSVPRSSVARYVWSPC